MRIAVLADIHSNLPALEAVRADLHLTAPDMVLVGGDQVNRCPWPNEVLDLIEVEGWPMIAGNHELMVASLDTPDQPPVFNQRQRFADLWWTRDQLRPEHLASFQELPLERRIEVAGSPTILLLHGLKNNPFEGIVPEMDDAQILAKL